MGEIVNVPVRGAVVHMLNPRLDCRTVRVAMEVLTTGGEEDAGDPPGADGGGGVGGGRWRCGAIRGDAWTAAGKGVGRTVSTGSTSGLGVSRSPRVLHKWGVVTGTGAAFSRNDPAEGRLTWEGHAAAARYGSRGGGGERSGGRVGAAAARTTVGFLDAFAKCVTAHREEFIAVICLETGRPRWEVKTECDALVAKIDLTKKAFAERRGASSRKGRANRGDALQAARRGRGARAVQLAGATCPTGISCPRCWRATRWCSSPASLRRRVGERTRGAGRRRACRRACST